MLCNWFVLLKFWFKSWGMMVGKIYWKVWYSFVNNMTLSTMLELCQSLARTGKSRTFYLIDRLIRLILTLPVSTTTTERSFSAMKIIKTRLRNKMEDEFLVDNMIIYIEKEIAENFSSDSIIDEFRDLKERRAIF